MMVWAASQRETLGGDVLGEAERITPLQALRALTIDAAHQTFQDDVKGSVEVGKYADLVVLNGDPTAVDPADIRNINVLYTWVGGNLANFRPAASGRRQIQ